MPGSRSPISTAQLHSVTLLQPGEGFTQHGLMLPRNTCTASTLHWLPGEAPSITRKVQPEGPFLPQSPSWPDLACHTRRAGKQPIIHGPFSTEPPGGSAAAGIHVEGVTASSTCHGDMRMPLNSCLLETTLLISRSTVESHEHHVSAHLHHVSLLPWGSLSSDMGLTGRMVFTSLFPDLGTGRLGKGCGLKCVALKPVSVQLLLDKHQSRFGACVRCPGCLRGLWAH